VAGARPNHQPIGGSDPNHQGIWSPPRAGTEGARRGWDAEREGRVSKLLRCFSSVGQAGVP